MFYSKNCPSVGKSLLWRDLGRPLIHLVFTYKKYILLSFYMLLQMASQLYAQTESGGLFDPKALLETKWKYTYMTHVESNIVIHQAVEEYKYFLYFKLDNTYEQFLNDKRSSGSWFVEGDKLQYPFRKTTKFQIKAITANNLVLEFEQLAGKGHFQYHFESVSDENAPFAIPFNQLPEIKITAKRLEAKENNRWAFGNRKKKKKVAEPKIEAPYLSIEMTGGGFFGGADPVFRDYIRIKTDGRLIKEFKSKQRGSIVTKKNIPRAELDRFMQFVIEKGYFDYNRLYDCADNSCMVRKRNAPRPLPLQLSIAYGTRKKVINVAIWGRDEKNVQYVDYPPELDAIIEALQKMANRID